MLFRSLPQIQDRRGVVWAGAWCGYGFHEDGLVSALRAVQALDATCLPAWAVVEPVGAALAATVAPKGAPTEQPAPVVQMS